MVGRSTGSILVPPCPGRSGAWSWTARLSIGANCSPVRLKPCNAATGCPEPKTRTLRPARERSGLIFDRDFDRHRTIRQNTETGSGDENQESDDELLHTRIVPDTSCARSQNRLGMRHSASVCSYPCRTLQPPAVVSFEYSRGRFSSSTLAWSSAARSFGRRAPETAAERHGRHAPTDCSPRIPVWRR